MKTCKVLMPAGALGAGIHPQAFENGLAMAPDVIAVDAGSTDSGPAYLARGMGKYARPIIKKDLAFCITGAKKLGIPLFIGSCGTCGTDNMVDEFAEIAAEILRENGLAATIATVYSQQDARVIGQKWRDGKVHALEGAPPACEETLAACENIVALMGSEPFIEAWKAGADIVLCGRTTDTAIIAALPVQMGCNEAAAWHGAKTVECGAQCTDDTKGKGVFLTVDEEGFTVTPLLPGTHCTPYTVSAHLLYENVDPYTLTEPAGRLLTHDAVYTQVDEQSVRVTGSRFEHAETYTMKLEGAGIVGYQNISLVGMADPAVMADPQGWIDNISAYVADVIEKAGIAAGTYSFNFKAYGYNGVLPGPPPGGTPAPREIGMLLTVTAATQELATQVAKIFNPYLLHFPANMEDQMPSFAFPFSPVDCPRGACYEFMLHHVVETDDPLELVRIKYTQVG